MLESLFATTTTSSTGLSLTQVILSIVIALGVGLIVSLTYIYTDEKGSHSQNFAWTLILLPGVIAIIIMLIGSDVARAFSLAGAFSIIRFRSAPGEPKDIAYVLFALAAGLACGVSAFSYAILFTVVLCLAMVVLNKTKFGAKKRSAKLLQITVPEDLDYEQALKEVFQAYTQSATIKRVKTAALGSLYQIQYEIQLKDENKTKQFLDELRMRNGNLNISLTLSPDNDFQR